MVKVSIKFIKEHGKICNCRHCWRFVPDKGLNVLPLIEHGLHLTDNMIVNETLYIDTHTAETLLFKTFEMLEETLSLYFLARAKLSKLLHSHELKSNFINKIPPVLLRDVMDFKFNYTPHALQACSLIIPRIVSQHIEGFRIQKTTIL